MLNLRFKIRKEDDDYFIVDKKTGARYRYESYEEAYMKLPEFGHFCEKPILGKDYYVKLDQAVQVAYENVEGELTNRLDGKVKS